MKKTLSRAQISQALERQSLAGIFSSALFFLTAGSLWVHLSLGSSLLGIRFITSWILIHAMSFLILKFEKASFVWLFGALVSFQFYCYSILSSGYGILPLASTFFVVSALSLMAAFRWRAYAYIPFWAALWASALAWSPEKYWSQKWSIEAVLLTVVVNALFVFGFFVMFHRYSKKQAAGLRGMGAKESYDSQRIHAARMQMLGELSASLSHEISNPLTNLHGYLYQIQGELDEDGNKNQTIKSAMGRVEVNLEHLMDVVGIFKSFSKKKKTTAGEASTLKEVIDSALKLTSEHVRISKVDLHVEEIPEGVEIKGSSVELTQVLVNFLTNARDACRHADQKQIRVGAHMTGSQWNIWVEDSGGGVPSDIKDEIFQPFFTTKGEDSGTGLGLYISAMIAKRHGAHLQCENIPATSNRPAGARFSLLVQTAQDSKAKAA